MPEKNRSVVVTALGAVSPAGTGVEALWTALSRGRDCVGDIVSFDASPYECRRAALIPDEREDDPAPMVRRALAEALDGADLSGPTGLSLGTTLGGNSLLPRALAPRDHGPQALRGIPYFGVTDILAEEICPTRAPSTVSGACASSLIALGLGFLWIRTGQADHVVAGGYDRFNEFVHSGFSSLKALTPGKVRPFDLDREGITLGEGAGILLLEEEAAARKAGRRPLARITGFACLSDANHITGPHPDGEGLFRTVCAAMAMGGHGQGDIDFILAHGTGTVYNDRSESIAVNRFFSGGPPPCSSIKSMIGHTLGAAGALESIASICAMEHNTAPPTIHYETPDPECRIDPVPGRARAMPIRRVLKTASGFGGQNACMVFEKADHG